MRSEVPVERPNRRSWINGAFLFACKNHSVYEPGTLVEMVGIGVADRDDRDPEEPGRVLIRAQAILDDGDLLGGWWYFRARDLEPLTSAAVAAWRELLHAEAKS